MNAEQSEQLVLLLTALQRDFYHPLGDIALRGFTAEAALTLAQAEAQPCQPLPEGSVWGAPWRYAWMFGQFALPEAARDERIVLSLNPGGESTLFVNGEPFGTRRAEWVICPHHYRVDQQITQSGVPGESYTLALEAYAGHPVPVSPNGHCATGPIFPGEDADFVGEPKPATVGANTFGLWNEEAYQLWLDLDTLGDVWLTQPEASYLRDRVAAALCDVLDTLDVEIPLPERRAAYCLARERLAPVMAAHNGTFAPTVTVMGNSHLDVAWLWPLEETRRKTARTFAQQLRLLQEYPEAMFLQSQCVLYELCRVHYPAVFERIREAIRRGQWIAEGAMWLEPDTNMVGGEALIRQFVYGKRYYREVLGVDSRVAWLPDTFGYTAALPQILRGCDVDGLTTQKIFWSYNDAERFPHHAFRWQGMDGSEVQCYLHMNYESRVNAATLVKRWAELVEHDDSGAFFQPFGYGDGGGGPTRDDLEQLRRTKDLQGVPRTVFDTPAHFLKLQAQRAERLPRYVGELYFQCHRGTYTTQAAVKNGNRRSEQAMRAWECWAALAAWDGHAAYPYEGIETTWKNVLLNQFHDILPGSSIPRVYEEALALYATVARSAEAGLADAALAFTREADGVTLLHAHSAAATRVVALDGSFVHGAVTPDGLALPCVPWEGGALCEVALPAMGHLSLLPAHGAPPPARVTARQTDEGFELANEHLRVIVSPEGLLTCVELRETGRCFASAPSNRFRLYRDLPRYFDAWDIDSPTENREIPFAAETRVSLEGSCALRASVRVEHLFLHSIITQHILLDAGQPMVTFDTTVDWQERHKLLKVCFATGVQAEEAMNQMQFGYVCRPTHRSRRYDEDRFEVCNHGYTALADTTHGAAVLNDCKYGVSMLSDAIALTLLRGATHPDLHADQGMHRFRYAYRVWEGSAASAGLAQAAAEFNAPVVPVPGSAPAASYFRLSDNAVVLDTVKLAEDRSGDLILRLYESERGSRAAHLQTSLGYQRAMLCNMLETPLEEAEADENGIRLLFHPFEIITLRLSRATSSVKEDS